MTDRIPTARIPAARTADAGTRAQPASPRRDRVFLAALWQILVAMGGPFVPLMLEFEDDADDPGWSDPR
jgi:hypothetical protein